MTDARKALESARDPVDELTDIACGVGNVSGLTVFEGHQRNLIELGIRRLLAAGYAIDAALASGEQGWRK